MANFKEQSNEGRPLSHGDFAAFHKTTPLKMHEKGLKGYTCKGETIGRPQRIYRKNSGENGEIY